MRHICLHLFLQVFIQKYQAVLEQLFSSTYDNFTDGNMCTCGMTIISEKMIDASRSNLLSGCMVTSQACSGFRQISKNSCFFLYSRNSLRYRPACLMIQIGVRSTSSPRHSRNTRSFVSSGNSLLILLKESAYIHASANTVFSTQK